ncbi:MAG: cytochrome C oxidase subunit IV [Xanthomonadales bacterium]|nr:cytochrome C oxidase subunit IV [Xanthomonadales bacterium]NIN59063.1 cytochrome C oxidase subunit IV [Xanthomonadales bacterium]NIN74367.1 cytochrome C oxidase subunit IV [Xanthomonadales bacterium]NIO13172.1 cytochrome C oxidase subunit IV [Xanthomonadales bacterium]NIP11456.1 cytochrome C oxidase subunit IV [Xanthomonadales bacterium]
MTDITHETGHQQHPLGIYIWVWILLFVLSFFSYMVDYYHLQGMLRWSLIIIFMLLKAGFIVAIFMHMAWERIALIYAILIPPLCLLVFIGLMAIEGEYTTLSRLASFTQHVFMASPVHH